MDKFNTQQFEVDINHIFPNPWNPNRQNDETFDKEKQSITAFGMIDPILVREKEDGTYEIIDGEHRWRACLELGFTKMKVESIGKIDDSSAKLLTINLNNLRGKDDIFKRAALLKEINLNQLSLLFCGEEGAKEEMKLLDFDFSQFEKTQVTEEEQDKMIEAGKLALSLSNKLRQIHNEVNNTELKLLIEGYFDWFNIFQGKLKK